MKTIMLTLTLAFCSFAATCSGQALTGSRVLLEDGFPYIRFTDTTAGENRFIDSFDDQLAFYVSDGYKFRINENARANALVVNSNGITLSDNGSGTQLEINHTDTGQIFGVTSFSSNNGFHNGGIGFKTNSAGFPLYVFDTARDESLSVRQEGVGVGTYNAIAPLHVYADGSPYAEAKVLVENNLPGAPVLREMFSLVNNGGAKFSFTDTNLGTSWSFATTSVDQFAISRSSIGSMFVIQPTGRVLMGPGPVRNFDLLPNGNLKITGTLTQSSDRNMKTAFVNVEVADVLDRVAKMPVQTWQFKFDEPELRHMGPTAQDFHAAFGLGVDDKTIAPVDGIGVSLAAIKALYHQGIEKSQRIEELEADLSICKRQLAEQQALLTSLLSRLENVENITIH